MPNFLSRRAFALGTAGLAASTLLPRTAFAQSTTRSVTTSLGTYDIPASPQRVVTIDSRIDLQPALALGLPVIGYGHSVPGDWVPVSKDAVFFGSIVNIEQVLAAEPDLIICADYDPDSEYWPINKLKTIAPVLPVDGDAHWRQSLQQLAGWLGLDGADAAGAVAAYDALIADIKARHGDKLRQKKVVSVQPEAGSLYPMNGTTMLHNLVLTDLGANFMQPAAGEKYNGEQVATENFGTVFGDIDGFLIATEGTDELDALNKEPLWQRLPAVTAGAVVASNGNVNYGSIYSATHLARMFDELYGKIA